MIPARQVLARARHYLGELTRLLREMIAIPGESGREGRIIRYLAREMRRARLDEVRVDPMGNLIGRLGRGRPVIALDAHVDTVGVGRPDEWSWDPYQGKLERGVIYGRGASDQRGALASMLVAARILRELDLLAGCTLLLVGSVQEEDCDGLCWQYLVREEGLRPECVVLTEPTDLNIHRGQRGRMEMEVTTLGVSCHGSAPERGVNAVYRMARVVQGLEALGPTLRTDPFLGQGSIAVTRIESTSPSLCAVPAQARIHIDRRLTRGESKSSALREVRAVLRQAGLGRGQATVEVPVYDTPSYTGLSYPTEKVYPTWVLPRRHPLCRAAEATSRGLFGKPPRVDRWTFSTNGVATMGLLGIPTVGFGPGRERHAHSVADQVPVRHLVQAAAWYALFPGVYRNARR